MVTAIRAQGTKINIETGSGGAKNITAITKAYPPVVTSSSHGLSDGDRVTIASVVGMTELNGNTYTVDYCTTNTFCLKDVDASGYTTYDSAGTATPVTMTAVGGAKNIDTGGGKTSEVDTTDLDSTAKEFVAGLPDYGEASFECNVDFSDAGQNAIRERFEDGAEVDFQVVYADTGTTTENFTGFVSGYGTKLSVDGVVTASVTIRKKGVTTWA